MGFVAPCFWALSLVAALTFAEFAAFKSSPEFTDIRLVLILVCSLLAGCFFHFRKNGFTVALYSWIGFLLVALFAYWRKLDFYYFDYPQNIIEFLPNLLFKPAILILPFVLSLLVLKCVIFLKT